MSIHNSHDSGWLPFPRAADLVDNLLRSFSLANPTIAAIQRRLLSDGGVRLGDLIDHWALPIADSQSALQAYFDAGFQDKSSDGIRYLEHDGARLPRVRPLPSHETSRLAIRVENIQDFALANDFEFVGQHGDPDSGYEEARLPLETGVLAVIVRQGYSGFHPGDLTAGEARAISVVRQRLANRPRTYSDRADLLSVTDMLRAISEEIGPSRTVDEFFAAERLYFTSRNRAAQWQYERQLGLGIGWSNHDHHTYRSARPLFRAVLRLWGALGFTARERLHAGEAAGWGACVLEHPESRVVLFCDADLTPEEIDSDALEHELAPSDVLGHIGLWCALHGSSISRPGLHHLECEFDYHLMRIQCDSEGFAVMPPFTDLPTLKQCFTAAEVWQVSSDRLLALRDHDLISAEQVALFRDRGAAGSHLEILQRWDGYRGFHKTGITVGIAATSALAAE